MRRINGFFITLAASLALWALIVWALVEVLS